MAELSSAQHADPVLTQVLSWYDHGTGAFVRPPESSLIGQSRDVRRFAGDLSLFRMQDGVLYRVVPSDTDCDSFLLVVPDSLKDKAVTSVHCVPGGHQGQDSTLTRCRQRFYWLGMTEYVRNFVRSCGVCEQSSKRIGPGVAPLGCMTAGYCFECVGVDLVGPLPVSSNGFQYILVAVDYFTRWTEAYPLRDIHAQTIVRALVDNWVSRFGAPVRFHSDQGRQFEATIFSEMCRLLGITKTRSSPYHPQGNGRVERVNRTLKESLRATVASKPLDWDLYLPLVLLSYRSSVHSSTGFTPARMLFGQELRLPVDIVFGFPEVRTPVSPVEYVVNLDRSLRAVHTAARSFDSSAHRVQKEWYDKQAHGSAFPDGSYVWLLDTAIPKGSSKAFHWPWKGPYKVLSSSGPVFHLETATGPVKRTRVHFNRLKACFSKIASSTLSPVTTTAPSPPSAMYEPWPDAPAPPPPPPAPPPQPPPAGFRHRQLPRHLRDYHIPPRHRW